MSYRTALLVEDDDTLCRVIDRNLAARGVSMRRASSAGEALAAVAATKPDVMLLDIDLPDRTGWDVLRALAARGIHVPTVVISGTRVPAERLAEFRPVAYLPKPFPLDALVRIVTGSEDTDGTSNVA